MSDTATLHIEIDKADGMPGFAAYAYHPDQGDERLVLLNMHAIVCAARDCDVSVKEMMVGSLMHEFGHILENWFDLEFDDERLERIIESYYGICPETPEPV